MLIDKFIYCQYMYLIKKRRYEYKQIQVSLLLTSWSTGSSRYKQPFFSTLLKSVSVPPAKGNINLCSYFSW